MIVCSEIHDWRKCEAIKQIRVFTSESVKSAFDVEYANATSSGANADAIKKFSDTGKGVAYKIRAVRDVHGDWVAMIRCGHTGCIIWKSNITQNTWPEAMANALGKLQVLLTENNFHTIWAELISASKAGQR